MKHYISGLIVLLTVAACGGSGGDSALALSSQGGTPTWVNALAIGQWYEIPNTAMSSVVPSPQPGGNSGPASKVGAWTSFVADTRTSKVYSVANGGHSDYAGNEVDVLDLERDQPAWSQVLAPTPNSQLANGQSYYLDGRPTARHTYYGITSNEVDGRIMLFGGAIWCASGCGHAAISSYDIAANAYSPSSTHGAMTPIFNGDHGAFSADPSTGDVYATSSNGKFAKWTRSTNTFAESIPIGPVPGSYYAASAIDITRGRMLIVGGQGFNRHTYTLATNTFALVTLTGASASSVTGSGQASLVYVAALDVFLHRRGGAGGTVLQIDPVTFAVTPFATTDGASVPSTLNGPFNKFLYVPRLGGAVYVPAYSGNARFLRLH